MSVKTYRVTFYVGEIPVHFEREKATTVSAAIKKALAKMPRYADSVKAAKE